MDKRGALSEHADVWVRRGNEKEDQIWGVVSLMSSFFINWVPKKDIDGTSP